MPDIFDVVADATRRDILTILRDHQNADSADDTSATGVSVSEIVTRLGLNQPTVSKHLKVLRDAGLAAVDEKGHHRYYRLESAPLDEVASWVTSFTSRTATDALPRTSSSHNRVDALTAQSHRVANAVGKAAATTAFRISALAGTIYPPRREKVSSTSPASKESANEKTDESPAE